MIPQCSRQRGHGGEKREDHQDEAERHEERQGLARGVALLVGGIWPEMWGFRGRVAIVHKTNLLDAAAVVVALQAVRVLLLDASCVAWTVVHDAIDATDGIVVGATAAAVGIATCHQGGRIATGLHFIARGDAGKLRIRTRDQKADGKECRHRGGQQAHLDDSSAGKIPFLDQVATEKGATASSWHRDQTHHQCRVHGRNAELILDLLGQEGGKSGYHQTLRGSGQVQEKEGGISQQSEHRTWQSPDHITGVIRFRYGGMCLGNPFQLQLLRAGKQLGISENGQGDEQTHGGCKNEAQPPGSNPHLAVAGQAESARGQD